MSFFILPSSFCLSALAQGTAFTYQGRLNDGANIANGIYDLRFAIYDAASGPAQVGSAPTNVAVTVSNGLFTVTLDFGPGVFIGADRWLEIGVRSNSGGAFFTLAPRQRIASTPYAVRSANAASAAAVSGPVAAAQITGVISSNNIAAGSITTTMLAAGAVGANQLAPGAVTTSALAEGAVTASKVMTVSNWFSMKIASPNSIARRNFGRSLASLGGDRFVVGTSWRRGEPTQFGDYSEAAYLYSDDGRLLASFPNPSQNFGAQSGHGMSVAVLGGDRVLVGSPFENQVYLFNTNGVLLTRLTPPLYSQELFGWSVAAVGSQRVLVGEPFSKVVPLSGSAYLFSTNGTLLTIVTNPAPSLTDYYGWAVAALGEDRLLVSSFQLEAVYLFDTNGVLLNVISNPGGGFGWSLAALGNDRVLVGSRDASVAYLFSTNGSLLATFTNPTPAIGDFGESLMAVGVDKVLIGSAGGSGAAHLFSTNGTLLATFTNPVPAENGSFGSAVAALSEDKFLFGAPLNGPAATNAGSVFLFKSQVYTPGLVAGDIRAQSITTSHLDSGIGVWFQSGNDVFRHAGNVGIGTYRPQARLDVVGEVRAGKFSGDGSGLTGVHGTITNAGNSFVGSFVGNGSALTNLNADTLLSGVVPDARLSTNAALRAGGNAFTGNQTISDGSLGLGTASPGYPLDVQAGQAVGRFTTTDSVNGAVLVLDNATPAFAYYGAINFQGGSGQISYLTNNILAFRTASAERMRIDGSGGVGIGKASPSSRLDVNGDIRLNDFDLRIRGGSDNNHGLGWRAALDGPFLYGYNGGGLGVSGPDTYVLTWSYLGFVLINSNLFVGNNVTVQNGGNLSFDSPNSTIQFPATGGANKPMITMFASGTGNSNRMVIAHSPGYPDWGLQYQDTTDKFHFLSGGTPVLTVDLANNRVGIGTSSPGFQLQLSADSAAKPNGGSWANSSDARLKKHIEPLTGALDKLAKLRGVSFEWINPQDHANQTSPQGGFVAQEVEAVFPHWVQEVPGAEHDRSLTPNGRIKSLSLPFEFDALLVEALREVRAEKDAQIAALERANAEMKRDLAAQKELTSRMEARFTTLEKALARLGEKSAAPLLSDNR